MATGITSVIIRNEDLSEALAAQQRVLLPLSRTDMSFGFRKALGALSLSPVVISQHVFRQMAAIHMAIDKAVHALVNQWPGDHTLQQIIEVPDRIAPHLTPRENAPPYRVGTIRPDFLLDEAGNLKVCEINARFPLNGYLVVAKYMEGLSCECFNPHSLMARLNVSPVGPMLSFIPDLRKRLMPNGPDTVVFHLRGREPMHDTAMIASSLQVKIRRARPSQLAVSLDPERALCLTEEDGSLTQIKSAVIELHQDELLALSDDVLAALADLSHAGRTLNDLRTIFLAHDKAFLHVITQGLLVGLDDETRDVLRTHVIPTVKMDANNLADNPFGPSVSRVVKPALSGKGNGIVMEKNVGTDDFHTYLHKLPSDVPFILQPYVKQLKFEALDEDGNTRFLRSVGIISGMDGTFYGPGVFRCNDNDLVSVTGGGFPLVPAMRLVHMPPMCKIFCQSLAAADVAAINSALIEHGIALVGTSADLRDKHALERFLTEGLGGRCRTHSDTEGAVWDVRPVPGWTTQYARSHTTKPFEVHTDASFERIPPRFVAMAALRSDRCGGGELSVIRISEAVTDGLREDQVQTLLTACPRWIVPHEFFKSGVDEVHAPVLMSRERARFRCDKLCTEHMKVEEARQFREAFAAFREELERKAVGQSMVVPEQTIIILDNHRFAHARSHVFDMERHLLRVRFDMPHMSLLD